jgi:hypothetical protein
MILNSLKQKFTARRHANDGTPVPRIWVGNEHHTTLINPDSGKAHAYIWHDGYGKCHPTVVVSPWHAFRLIKQRAGFLVSLLGFPRFTVELYQVRATDVTDVEEVVEEALGLNGEL